MSSNESCFTDSRLDEIEQKTKERIDEIDEEAKSQKIKACIRAGKRIEKMVEDFIIDNGLDSVFFYAYEKNNELDLIQFQHEGMITVHVHHFAKPKLSISAEVDFVGKDLTFESEPEEVLDYLKNDVKTAKALFSFLSKDKKELKEILSSHGGYISLKDEGF